MVAKLESVWAYQYTALESHPYYHHVVISPPDDWMLEGDTDTVYWRSLDVVKEILDELGLAGVPVYHPYRGSEEKPGDDRGEWKERIFAGRDWDDVEGELQVSPHFHVLGVSPHVDISVTERVEEQTGWTIHRITQGDSNVSIGNSYDLARVAAYCLSHAGIYEDSNGDMSAAYHPRISERVPEGTPTPNEETEQEADRLVRSVSPKVLDVEYQSVACDSVVDESVAADDGVLISAGHGSDEPNTTEEGDLVECNGRMLHISQATDFLSDSEWRERAVAADSLERRYHEWKRETGIS